MKPSHSFSVLPMALVFGVARAAMYTPQPYTSVYTPPPYTISGYTAVYQPPPYTSVYTPAPFSSSFSSGGHTTVYTPPPHTKVFTPPPYTLNDQSTTVTPAPYTMVYTPEPYTSVYTPPASHNSGPIHIPSISHAAPEFTSVPYPTYDEVTPTGTPTYTLGPGETSYAPDTNEPAQALPDPSINLQSVRVASLSALNGNFTPVVGAPGVELRLPIDELQTQYPDVWNMFLIALESMMAVEESIDISYYQISGIHGLPHIPWQYPESSAKDPDRGYCTHGSALFSTWHRPYMILVEQILVQHAVDEANKFTGPDANKYKDAAKKVRIPYWDWASESTKSHLPASIVTENLNVIKPAPGTGEPTPVTISNPLFGYKFTRADYRETYFNRGFFRNTDSTRRQPDGSGASRNNLADREMANTYDSRRQNTFNLFTIPTFQGFSSNAWDGGSAPNAWTSVESIHNNIHGNLGGSFGHMSFVDYAAFDPIFWLHHCNVDRLTAMYQAVWPGNEVLPQKASGTFARKVENGDMDDINTPLYPFRHTDGNEWTSKDVSDAQSIYRYGYAYPEVPPNYQGRSDAELQAFTITKVNELYRPALQPNITAPPGASTRREWIAHMAVDEADIPGDFEALLFVGDVPHKVEEWKTAPDLIGGCTTFSGDSNMHHVVKATVPLTKTLVDNGVGLEPKDVVKYLKEKCKWVVKQGGSSVPLSNLKSLKVGISSSEVQYPDDQSKLAEWGQAYTYYEITDGKPGGLQANETYLVQSEDAPLILDSPTALDNNATTFVPIRERSRPFRL